MDSDPSMLFTLIQIFLFLLSIKFYKELITLSKRFHAGARVTAFSQTSLFLERFGANFEYLFKFLKPFRKTYRPKNDTFYLLITFIFAFYSPILRLR